MVKVEYNGRFGNNLCQYILGRIIAEELGYKLSVPHSGYMFLQGVDQGLKYHTPVKRYGGHLLDLQHIIDDPTPRRIIIEGYFQRFEYYKPYRDRIKNWFNDFVEYSCMVPGKGDLVLHVRGGDLWRNKLPGCQHAPIPLRFYQEIIETTECEDIHIVTENRDDPIVKRLVEMYPKIRVVSQSVLEDFLFIFFAQGTVALSMSTLAWWASWLSSGVKEVHFPLYGFWHPDSPRQDIEMRVTGDSRYIYHDYGAFHSWEGRQDQIEYIMREL